MKNISLLLLIFIAIGCKKTISEADKQRATELNNKAVEYRLNNDLEKAKEYFVKALAIDSTDFSIRNQFIGVYIEQDSIDKAFQLLEEFPEDQKESQNFYQINGLLYEYKKQMDKALESYKKALELTDLPSTIEDEMDLGLLVNYTMLETLAGKKEQAVNRLNKALELDWLTENNKEYLETFRNEFEFYQGNGNADFNFSNDLTLQTTNADSLELLLKNNHINTSGSGSRNMISTNDFKNDTVEIYVDEKYKEAIHQLGIKTYPNKIEKED